MKSINQETMNEFAKTYKVALISSIDDMGEPHISFITTLQAKNETELTAGEFITGLSKRYMQERNKVGFLVMSLGKEWWNGTAVWKDKKTSGEDYDMYNQIPMFRYNTYFGIHTVHYFDLFDVSEKHKLDMAGIIINGLMNSFVKTVFKRKTDPSALTAWAYNLFKNIATLKFISFIDEEGFPRIYPIVQAQACDKGKIVIPMHPYSKELSRIKEGTKVAVMGMNLDMEDVLVKGTFHGFKAGMGYVDIERVYNSLPPVHGYIYPVENTI
ncbi:MAG: hypothetical protein JXN65_10770 [Clostridia bacterium]|nr:hypothetical protein [Clostridia bacterium]